MDDRLEVTRPKLEFLRSQSKMKFDTVRQTWIDAGRWALPHRIKWMLSQTPGERNNQHIVDPSHVLALRSYVAGFLEGNTSASRPWFKILGSDPDKNLAVENKAWLQLYTNRVLACLSTSNFYHSAGQFYYDFGVFNTGAHYIDELPNGNLYFHNLIPGSYYIINNALGEAIVLVREFQLSVKALVDMYARKKNGNWDWSNFSSSVKKMYDDGNYTQMVDVVHIVKENQKFDPQMAEAGMNRRWQSFTYESGTERGPNYTIGIADAQYMDPSTGINRFLKMGSSKRKPFIIGKSDSNGNFEYGEKGPTTDALGLIRSLSKKALAKDQAIEMMIRPPLQGPASLRKSYITSAPNSFIPLDPQSVKPGGGLKSVFEINPAIGSLIQDQQDLRNMIDKIYYGDYLLYLSRNPRTRTATETNAIVQEQQLVIGPNLQSLNFTYNIPVVEFVMDYVLDNDEFLPPPPEGLAGQFMRTEFISVFAQAQRAADLPSVERYMAMIGQVGQLGDAGQKIFDKVNLDKLADLYEDRLYLPVGLNNPQDKVDAQRQQAMMQQQKQMQMEQLQQASQAAKNVGLGAQDLGLKGGDPGQGAPAQQQAPPQQ